MDENSNNMGDATAVENEVENNGNNDVINTGVSKVVAAAKLIKNLSQSSMKNVPPASVHGEGGNKLEKQGSTDSAKELAKAVKVATFVRTLSKASIDNGNRGGSGDAAQEATENPPENAALTKVSKAAKIIRQLSKTAMLVSSNTPSIDEGAADLENDPENDAKIDPDNDVGQNAGPRPVVSKDVSKIVQAANLIKRLSEQSMEKEKSGKNDVEKSEVGNDVTDDVETASCDAVLGDDEAPDAETVEDDTEKPEGETENPEGETENPEDETENPEGEKENPEEEIKDKDPKKVAKAAALVRQLSKQSMTRTGSAGSLEGAGEGENTEGRKFKGRWRKSVRDRSRETSLEVQEKIAEQVEPEIPEQPETEIPEQPEEEDGEKERENNENGKTDTNSSGGDVITKQPSVTVDADGIKTIESSGDLDKPRTGFCPCL